MPAELCIPTSDITDPLLRPGGTSAWAVVTDNIPGAGKSSLLTRWVLPVAGTPPPPDHPWTGPDPVPGRGLSGGVLGWSRDGSRLAVITAEGPWWGEIDDVGAVRRASAIPVPPSKSWSGPVWSPDGAWLAIVADWSEVWSWEVGSSAAHRVVAGPDFVIDPAWWQGRVVAQAWERPDMPWTRSRIAPDVFDAAGAQAQQPRTSPDGTALGFLTDAGGTLNVRVLRDTGETLDLTDRCEAGGPTWGPGQRSWCWSPDSRRIAVARNVDGFGVLSVVDTETAERTDVGRGVHGAVSWEGDRLVALRTGARTPPQVVAYDVSPGGDRARMILTTADPRWDAPAFRHFRGEMVEPESLTVAGPGGPVPVRLYRSRHSGGRLLCWVHGGPTDQWQVTFMARLVYWLSRGYDIAVVDHRGTTGHGRRFMLALHGAWGRADADDLCAVADHLHSLGAHAPARTAFMGASAGGLTVLAAAAARPDLAATVVTSYPVVDLSLLAAGDDPFEAHYVPTLVGQSSAGAEPVLGRAASLAAVPILVFHGDADASVPLEHSRRLERALAPHGGRVDVRVFAGEGHGFRLRDNQLAEYALTEEHLAAHLA